MAPPPPSDWLGSFVESQVKSVVTWRQNSIKSPKVKAEANERFSADGNHFRAFVDSTTLPPDSRVQILEVLSIEDPVTFFVTDGFTRLRARLSEDAVATLENEIGEKIDPEIKNDVFAIRRGTVISTPMGPLDGLVQFLIEELEYQYHLRKPIGTPQPIEFRDEIIRLHKEITTLTNQQYPQIVDSSPSSSPEVAPANAANGAHCHKNGTPKSQQSQLALQSSPTPTCQSVVTQAAIATQVPLRKKSHVPTLAKDGIQAITGVNLALPIPGGFTVASNGISSSNGNRAPVADTTRLKLLNLMNKKKAKPSVIPSRDSPITLLPSQVQLEDDVIAISTSGPQPFPEPEPVQTKPNAKQISRTKSTPQRVSKDYSRRKVPRNQQKILDKASSWLPPMPGHEFPRPNIPIELLQQWNAQQPKLQNTAPEQEPPNATTGHPVPSVVSPEGDEPMETSRSSSESTSEHESEDEAFPWSQSPPRLKTSPRPKHSPRPPHSTDIGHEQPFTRPQKHGLPPDSSIESGMGRSKGQRTNSQRNHGGTPPSGRFFNPQPERLNSASRITPVRRQDLTKSITPRQSAIPIDSTSEDGTSGEHVEHSASQTKRPTLLQDGVNENFMKPSPRKIKPPKERQADAATPEAMKVTPSKANNDDNDDMEMDVPRSLSRDPAVEHRKRRSEFFKPAQRRQWIKQHYVPDPNQKFHFEPIWLAYRKAHPKDDVESFDFAEAIEEVYPSEADSPAKGLKLRSPKAAENVVSTLPLRASVADVDGAAEAPQNLQSRPEYVNGHRGRPLSLAGSVSRGTETMRKDGPQVSTSTAAFRLLPSPSVPVKAKVTSSPRTLPWPTTQSTTQSSNSILTSTARSDKVLTNVAIPKSTPIPTAAPPTQALPISLQTTADRILETPYVPSNRFRERLAKINLSHSPVAAANNLDQDGDQPRTKKSASETVGVFAEFAHAWKRLKPGGAWATPHKEKANDKPSDRRLNILGWEL